MVLYLRLINQVIKRNCLNQLYLLNERLPINAKKQRLDCWSRSEHITYLADLADCADFLKPFYLLNLRDFIISNQKSIRRIS